MSIDYSIPTAGAFNVASPCPRCSAIGAVYLLHDDGWCNSETTERAHMHRYCHRCTFDWKELPPVDDMSTAHGASQV